MYMYMYVPEVKPGEQLDMPKVDFGEQRVDWRLKGFHVSNDLNSRHQLLTIIYNYILTNSYF